MAIKFELNQVVRLALTRNDPKYNEMYKTLMFSVRCEDGNEDKLFLPEEYGDTMQTISVGEVFTVCKKKTVQRSTYYEIKVAVGSPAAAAPSKLESVLAASISHVQAQRAQVPSKVPAPAVQQLNESHLQRSNGTELSQLLGGCMVAVIDAAVVARDYAHEKGLTFSFGESSLQDLTSTLLIHVQKMAELDRRYPVAGAPSLQGGNVRAWRQ